MTTVTIASEAASKSTRGSTIAGRVLLALAVGATSVLVTVAGGTAATAAANPVCHAPGQIAGQPIVTNVSNGQVLAITCTGLPANTPFLFLDTSLLLAIDPNAQPLLTGQLNSPTALLSTISALPEINAASLTTALSSSTGTLSENYTLPTMQALDPNAVCPPTRVEYNSGLIGCAVAMINMQTQKVVAEGTFVTIYKGFDLLPPQPTLAVTPAQPAMGQAVTISDSPLATTYWWLATLVSLEGMLSGAKGHSSVVKIKVGGRRVRNNAMVTPASYVNSTFIPPRLTGTMIPKGRGRQIVIASLAATLSGLSLSIQASTPIHIG